MPFSSSAGEPTLTILPSRPRTLSTPISIGAGKLSWSPGYAEIHCALWKALFGNRCQRRTGARTGEEELANFSDLNWRGYDIIASACTIPSKGYPCNMTWRIHFRVPFEIFQPIISACARVSSHWMWRIQTLWRNVSATQALRDACELLERLCNELWPRSSAVCPRVQPCSPQRCSCGWVCSENAMRTRRMLCRRSVPRGGRSLPSEERRRVRRSRVLQRGGRFVSSGWTRWRRRTVCGRRGLLFEPRVRSRIQRGRENRTEEEPRDR